LFGDNGGLLGFNIGNQKYPEGLGGPSGFTLPFVGFIGIQQKSYPPFWASLYAH
jgi:hypothetical protein